MKVKELFNEYLTDPDSSFHKLRYVTRKGYERSIERIVKDMGEIDLMDLGARKLLRIHAGWAEGGKVASGHQLITQFRIGIIFGATILEDRDCQRLRDILSGLHFQNAKPRVTTITAELAAQVRYEAVVQNWLAIALAQAFQFDCALRQKDVIGEWVPLDDPAPSNVLMPDKPFKWIRGITREEVDADLVLTHKTSKRGQVLTFPLEACPSVMQEWFAAPPSGPLIIDPQTGLPFEAWKYRRVWRQIATKVGVPKNVWNMDSRSGRVTERIAAGVSLDDVRKLAGHEQLATTLRYSRETPEAIARALGLNSSADLPLPPDGKPWRQE